MDKADIVIIGSGVGGSAVAHQLAGSGAKILILELGDFLPNEPEANADYIVVSLSAKKYGPDSLLANTSSYYSDDLELSLLLGDQSVIGPI